jgi:polyhydroxybutyrate depolymerase
MKPLEWILWRWFSATVLASSPATKPATAPAAGDISSQKPGTFTLTISTGGYKRLYILRVPPAVADGKPLPLVVMMHGAGGTAMGTARHYGWIAKADAKGFLCAFPEALPAFVRAPASFVANPRFWNDGGEVGTATHRAIDDVGFIAAVLDDVARRYPVDPARIYLTGMSSGAGMTFRAGALLANRVAAIAPVAGVSHLTGIHATRPVPMLYIVGTADPLVPLAGGNAVNPWGKPTTKPSVNQTIANWLAANGEPSLPGMPERSGVVTTIRYATGAGDGAANSAGHGADTIFVTIDGQGHEWPGAPRALPERLTGPSIPGYNATDEIWNFFAAHPKPGGAAK